MSIDRIYPLAWLTIARGGGGGGSITYNYKINNKQILEMNILVVIFMFMRAPVKSSDMAINA